MVLMIPSLTMPASIHQDGYITNDVAKYILYHASTNNLMIANYNVNENPCMQIVHTHTP